MVKSYNFHNFVTQSLAMSMIGMLILLMLMTACTPVAVAPPDGVVYALQYGTTMHGALSALQGATGTQIFLREVTGTVTFVWPFHDGWAFLTVCQSACGSYAELVKATGGKANLVSASDMNKVREIMEYNGWKLITAAEVPTMVKATIVNAATVANNVGSTLFSWVVFPFIPSTLPAGVIEEIKG